MTILHFYGIIAAYIKVRDGHYYSEGNMKKVLSVITVIVLTAVLALSADAASVANHLFDKQGNVDKGGKTWSVYGWIVTDAEITSTGYILDNGDINSYKAVVTGIENDTRETASTKKGESDAYRDLELENAVKNGGMSAGVSWDILRAYRIQIVIDISGLAEGEHTVLLCVQFKDGGIAEAFRSNSEFTFKKAASGEEVTGGKGASTVFLVDTDTTDETVIKAAGWAGCTVETVKLGYKIDNGKTQFNDKYVQLVPIDESETEIIKLAGKYAFRFNVNFPINELPAGDHRIKIVMIDDEGGETIVGSGGGNDELMFYYETDEDEDTEGEQTQAETETETETETAKETEEQTEAQTEQQTEPQTAAATEPETTKETKSNEGKGLPVGAIIAIIAAAVIAVGVVVFVIAKKKK